MPLRIASLPGPESNNPYLWLFAQALSSAGIKFDGGLAITTRWLRERGPSYHAIHLHWPEDLWRDYVGMPIRALMNRNLRGSWRAYQLTRGGHALLGVHKLDRTLVAFRRRGLRIIWTVHNTEPHERASRFDRSGYEAVARNTDLLIFHTEEVKEQFLERHRTDAMSVVMAHGNYAGVYPPPRPATEVLPGLGLDPERPVVACLGNIRPYKGVDLACQAVERLGGEVQLIIAGRSFDRRHGDLIRAQAKRVPGIVLIPRFVDDQLFSDLAAASEAILLPYRQITTSGALLAAMTLGRGVVASNAPFFRQTLAAEPAAGLLVAPDSTSALAEGIRNYLCLPPAARSEAALRVAARYDWPTVTRPVVSALYRVCCQGEMRSTGSSSAV